MTSRPDSTDVRERAIRAELGRGVPLPDRLRDSLERAYGADLDGVRLHEGEMADCQIYGDNTMLRGGEGYQIASDTAQLSQRSLWDLLTKGTTFVSATDIAKRFPSKVHDAANLASNQTLEQWAYGFRTSSGAMFDGFKNRAVGSWRTRLGPVSIDNTGGWTWAAVAGKATDIAVSGDRVAWSIGPLGSDGNGTFSRGTRRRRPGSRTRAPGCGSRPTATASYGS